MSHNTQKSREKIFKACKILSERKHKITKDKITQERGGFKERGGCADHLLYLRKVSETLLAKERKMYVAFMDL